MTKEWIIFNLGTNNWQAPEQFASGSGILHEGHHIALNSLPGVKCFSMWPSDVLKTPPGRDDYRVFEIPHPIPICESAGPTSSKRWHSMSEEEVSAYKERLTTEVMAFMEEAEKKMKKNFNLLMAHHTFLNPVIMVEVNQRRVKKGLPSASIVAFCHGTALKMYENELEKLPDFPMRFYTWIRNEVKLFEDTSKVQGLFTVSAPQVDTFCKVFPNFPREHIAVTPCGFSSKIFHPIAGATKESVLDASLPQVLYDGFDASKLPEHLKGRIDPKLGVPNPGSYDKMVLFVGRFVDWKRLHCILQAAKKWESENKKILLIMAGSGPNANRKEYVDLAYQTLGLKDTFFIGSQGQDVLAKLYTISDIAAYPSKDEPFGMVFIETMGCGTPVIGAKSGGPKDFVIPEVGALIDEGTDDEITDRVYTTVSKALAEDWKKQKGAYCLQYSNEKFSLAAQCQKMLTFLDANFL